MMETAADVGFRVDSDNSGAIEPSVRERLTKMTHSSQARYLLSMMAIPTTTIFPITQRYSSQIKMAYARQCPARAVTVHLVGIYSIARSTRESCSDQIHLRRAQPKSPANCCLKMTTVPDPNNPPAARPVVCACGVQCDR